MQSKNNPSKNRIINFYKKLGPGLITGASDDDPSGIATYSQAGAQFGFMTLWTACFTFPLMVAIQEMCSRIGLVTGNGLTYNIKAYYSKWIFYCILLLIIPAIILNIAADIASMGAVSHLVAPYFSANTFCIFYTITTAITTIYLSYEKIMRFLKYCCLALFLYLLIPFTLHTPWLQVLKNTFIPSFYFDKEYLSIMVAILGTTISPYMFFWQAIMAAEEQKRTKRQYLDDAIQASRFDILLGMFTSNVVMYFIILTTGTVLFPHGIHHIETVEQAAKALEPLAGKFAYALFALGILGTGMLAIPVLSGSLSYILAIPLNIKNGLDRKFYQAKEFYCIIIASLIIALFINFLGFSPIKALLWTAILNGLIAPIMILLILHMANNRKIMRQHTNHKLSNGLGGCAFVLMAISSLLMIYYLINS